MTCPKNAQSDGVVAHGGQQVSILFAEGLLGVKVCGDWDERVSFINNISPVEEALPAAGVDYLVGVSVHQKLGATSP